MTLVRVFIFFGLAMMAAAVTGTFAWAQAATQTKPPVVIQLAESNTKSPNKLADKYIAGLAGGRYGTGGTASVVFKRKK